MRLLQNILSIATIGLIGTCTISGCAPGPTDIHTLGMEEACSLDQVKTQRAFSAKVLDAYTQKWPDPSSPKTGPAVSNFYSLTLLDSRGNRKRIGGWNAPDAEIKAILGLRTNQTYIFPDVLEK